MSCRKHLVGLAAAAAFVAGTGPAHAAAVTFTKLDGLTGGSPGLTAVFKADLSTVGLANILSVSITDSSFGLGGAGGQFSGFDLDAIKLSTTDCADAACATGLTGLSVFDFFSGIVFSPGAQRAPADPRLVGTNTAGTGVVDAVATLGNFDGNAVAAIPGAFGFVSLGDGGVIGFNLTATVSTAGLFLYIGEVGDNGELAAGSIVVRDTPVNVPVPASSVLAALGLGALAATRRRRA
jgi:hypothetical protein